MAFFTNEYLNEKRNEILADVNNIEYLVGETWYPTVINSKSISGNTVVALVSVPEVPSTSFTITKIRVKRANGDVIALQTITIEKNGTQNIIITLRIPFQEV